MVPFGLFSSHSIPDQLESAGNTSVEISVTSAWMMSDLNPSAASARHPPCRSPACLHLPGYK